MARRWRKSLPRDFLCSASLEMQTPRHRFSVPLPEVSALYRHLNTSHTSQLVGLYINAYIYIYISLVWSSADCLVARLYLKHVTITGSNRYLEPLIVFIYEKKKKKIECSNQEETLLLISSMINDHIAGRPTLSDSCSLLFLVALQEFEP